MNRCKKYEVIGKNKQTSVFAHRPRQFVAQSVRKPQANTFPYRPHTRLISNQDSAPKMTAIARKTHHNNDFNFLL